MAQDRNRSDIRSRRFKPVRAWAVVDVNTGRLVLESATEGSPYAIYNRRYHATEVAGEGTDRFVVPLLIRSARHKRR